MPRPDFFIVGAPKCGTSSLYDYLRQHPDVFLPDYKEPQFFGRDLAFDPHWVLRDESRYLALFDAANGARRIGDASASTLCSRTSAQEIKAFSPDARIIIMLRNPVDMVYSLHGQYLWSCNEDIVDFDAAFAAQSDRRAGRRIPRKAHFPQGLLYSDMASYASQVERFFHAFGRDRVCVILFDDFIRETPGCYQKVLQFLDLPPFEPDFRQVNPAKPIQSRHVNRLVLNVPGLLWLVRKVIPPSAKRRFQMWLPKLMPGPARQSMPSETRSMLCSHFKAEIDRLGRLLDRDLSHWYKTTEAAA